MATQKETLNAALDLAGRGWRVFRIKWQDKEPATKKGFKDATVDQDKILKMFTRKYNLAIATGPESGVWVLDLDGEEGIKAFEQLEREYGKVPDTVEVRTGDGRHLYFLFNGEPIKNRTKIAGPIDVRGAGGYVVVPPSTHKNGSSYEWINSPKDKELAEAPSWLVDLVLERDSSLVRKETSPLKFKIGEALDLSTDPGETKGGRHERALRLIGSELAKGTDPVEAWKLTVEWGRRCSPVLDESELLRLFGYCQRNSQGKSESDLDALNEEPLPPAPAWPVLNPDAYYGLAGDLVRKIEPETEADPAGILVGLLVSFGNLVGRSPHYLVEGVLSASAYDGFRGGCYRGLSSHDMVEDSRCVPAKNEHFRLDSRVCGDGLNGGDGPGRLARGFPRRCGPRR